ncbi:MAG TPA: ABC transporter ATP-binding protein [Terriglobales bacterium]|jgi:iron(III) transport system ATP-binding protein|nr:ABC transporter ATP-binding protein [Terriglobales bacterium]
MDKIRIVNLAKRYGKVVAAEEVTFSVGDKEFFSLLGPSGCGKSTVLRCVAGLEEPTEGEIHIGETRVNSTIDRINVPTEFRPIGMVFQNYAVWPHMTVHDNVAYPLKLKKLPKEIIETKLEGALHTVGLERLADRYPSQLSGGEQQRVALARALIKEPEVLLLDEPLSNLDAKLREQMRFELKDLQRRSGIPILYVTHDQTEALAMSDRLAIMNAGHIVQIGAPTEIYAQPVDRFVADFIGLMNFIPARIVGRSGVEATVEFLGSHRLTVNDRKSLTGQCVIAVRPEDIALGPAGPIRCRVEVSNYSGHLIDYKVRADGVVLRVQTPKTIYREGAELGFSIERAMLFPAF